MVAIFNNIPQLLLVLCLCFEVVYVFSIISYLFFQTRYDPGNSCLSLWQCFVTNTLQGFSCSFIHSLRLYVFIILGVSSAGQLYNSVGAHIDIDAWSKLLTGLLSSQSQKKS